MLEIRWETVYQCKTRSFSIYSFLFFTTLNNVELVFNTEKAIMIIINYVSDYLKNVSKEDGTGLQLAIYL